MICVSVCVSVSHESAEQIEMLFGMWALVGPRNTVLSGARIIPRERGVGAGGTGIFGPIVKYQ